MVFISIVTVNLNNLVGLKRTWDSIYQQKLYLCDFNLSFEWVVIDGGSTDGSAEFLKSINLQNHARFSNHITIEHDDGIYDAMNKGARKSKGAWLVFLNSGDIFQEEMTLEKIVSNLKTFENYDCLLFGFELKGKIRYPKPHFWIIWKMLTSHQAMIIKKNVMLKSLYSTEFKYASDYYLMNKLLTYNSVKKIKLCIIENEPYGSEKNYRHVELEYCLICKKFHSVFLCDLISFLRLAYDFSRIALDKIKYRIISQM